MFKSMILATVVLLSMSARAQEFSITGSVRDGKGNQVLAGATVQLEGTSRIAVTDEYGRFRLDKLAAGDYSLIAKFLGFELKTEKVSVTANTELTVTLQESSQMTDEVVVYATRANEKTP